MFKLLLMSMVMVLLPACVWLSSGKNDKPAEQVLQRALSGELILGKAFAESDLPERDLFELTPQMKAFAEKNIAGVKGNFSKVRALHTALMSPVSQGGAGITYSATYTLTGKEAFERAQANCISYTLLFVSLARHLGFDAHVNEVDLPPSWSMRDYDSIVFLRHVNAMVMLPRDSVVIDLEMSRYNVNYKQRLISEELASAQYYNNRGMDLAALGDARNAFLHLRKALLLDAKQSYIWNNMGSFYLRNHFLSEAEALYLRGLELNSRDLTIINNLSSLYREMGEKEKADDYYQRAEQHRRNNPYYMYSNARKLFMKGEVEHARDLMKKAIAKEKHEIVFYELAVKIYDALDDQRNAAEMREKLERERSMRLILSPP